MKETTRPDYYQILKVSPTATDLEIKSHYRRLSKQYHPDMGGSQTDMAAVNEAYRVLSDPFRRSIYDAERRRALHVPAREPEQPVYAPPRRQAVPRQYTYADRHTAPKRTRSWWAALSWSFAVAVILVGILLQLPLAEANGSSDTPTRPTNQPLTVNYPPDTSNQSTDVSQASNTNSAAANTQSTAPSSTQQPVQQTTCSNNSTSYTSSECYSNEACSDSSCQSQPNKDCLTKTIGLYKHTICSATGGSNNCTANTVGTHRFTMCD